MPAWLSLAEGPVMRFVLAVLILGLLRLALLTVWEIASAVRRASDQRISYIQIARETLGWLLPFGRLRRARRGYSIASFSFHLGILFAGFFLSNHIDILQANLGLSWPALYKPALDVLALATILAGSYLLAYRIYVHSSRALSKAMDYVLLVLILNIFVSGFVAGQAWNPMPYDSLMLFHTINGVVLLLITPFTKVAHCVLFPLIRLGSDIAWRFTPQGGDEVVRTLHGPQGRKI